MAVAGRGVTGENRLNSDMNVFVGDLSIDEVAVTATAAELNIMDGVTATAAEINAASDVSARVVQLPNTAYQMLAANSGKPHLIPNVSADRTFTFPTAAAGLEFEFHAQIAAADGHDWLFDTGSDTNYFVGGLVFLDTDGNAISVIGPDLNSNSILQIILPNAGTRIKFICDGTLWTVSGYAHSVTVPTFADQA